MKREGRSREDRLDKGARGVQGRKEERKKNGQGKGRGVQG